MTLIGRLETLGYTESDAHNRIEAFLAAPRTRLMDIRYKPYSRWNPDWNRQALKARYRRQYVHRPELGNLHYGQKGAPIRLSDPDPWVEHLAYFLARGHSYLLLCACKDYTHCHRKVVYERVLAALDPTREPKPRAVQAGEAEPLVCAVSLWEGWEMAVSVDPRPAHIPTKHAV